jgi:hypothetical protein
MSLFSKRTLLVGISTFIIGLAAYAAIWGMPGFRTSSVTVQSQAAAYLLDENGAVNGLLLASGDQLHFSTQTGEAIAAQIKIGDEVSATGRAGTKSDYGREVRLEQIQANGHTIIEAKSGPKHSGEKRGKREPKSQGERPSAQPSVPAQAGEAQIQADVATGVDAANASNAENAQATPPLAVKATGTIKAHLVNSHGDVNGLILSGGEQVRFSPKVGKLVVAAEQGADTLVSVEGAVVQNERGKVMRPALITVGNQTIALGR